MKIIQLMPTLAYGDAVGNDAIALHNILVENGYETKIYAENIDSRIRHGIAEYCTELPILDDEDILLYHFSTGSKAMVEILHKLSCRKIMIYHNITPKEYFHEYNQDLMRLVDDGRQELGKLREYFECCLADSYYNKQDLIKEGYTCPIAVLPILIPFEDYRKEPDGEVVARYSGDGITNILFTGRVSPNKKQEDVISAFSYYHGNINSKSRLFIVGSYNGMETYFYKLKKYTEELGISDYVVFTGHIPFSQILAYYSLADLFLCMSDHEGFCVPLLEAMSFSIPILAYRAAAVPETLGDAGMLVNDRNPVVVAEFIGRMLEDRELQDLLKSRMKSRLETFSYESTTDLFKTYLEAVLNKHNIEQEAVSSEGVDDTGRILMEKAASWANEIPSDRKAAQTLRFSDISVDVEAIPESTERIGLAKQIFKFFYRCVYALSPGLANGIKKVLLKPKHALDNYRELKRISYENASRCEGLLRHCDALQKCCERLINENTALNERCNFLDERCGQHEKNFLQERAIRERIEAEQRRVAELVYSEDLKPVMEDNGLINMKRYLPEGISYDRADIDQFYFDLSNVFRGPEDEILDGNEMFLPFLKEAAERNPKLPILDFGCGRGELLDLMAGNDILAIGVDMNRDSAQPAIDKGHKVVIGDAIDYLQKQKDGSFAGIAMIMVSEHVPFNMMHDGIFLFAKKIATGGTLVINTINPYCFRRMGNFRMDPSHINFLPPEIYKLIMEMAGFHDIRILWSAPIPEHTFNEDIHSRYENVTIVGYR